MILSSCDIGNPAYENWAKIETGVIEAFVYAADGSTELPVKIKYVYSIQDDEIFIHNFDYEFIEAFHFLLIESEAHALDEVKAIIEADNNQKVNF